METKAETKTETQTRKRTEPEIIAGRYFARDTEIVMGKHISNQNCLQAQIAFYSGRASVEFMVHTLGS